MGAAAVVLAGAGVEMFANRTAIGATDGRPLATPPPTTPPAKLIGDGSTQDTGPQPNQPLPQRLAPGEQPPQFVVMSWDGAGETGAQLFSRFRGLAQELPGAMTFFLSGIYLLPERNRTVYKPPRHQAGASDIGYLSDESVHATIEQVGKAWLDGHEIGTHFNGHFCGDRGVKTWSPGDWDAEIDQAVALVTQWRTNTGFTDLPPLPFDYTKELIGGRTPCLEGQANLLKAQRVQRWRYDTSGTGTQRWPAKFANGLWNLPMQQIPFPGHSFEVLAMDYNIMYNQSGNPNGDAAKRATWQQQARDAFLAGFRRAYTTNRAPLIVGNHFERWNGGIYMDAVADAARQMAQYDGVRFV
ncbi:hypothetical protein OHA72_46270 [Dactylosporangium sp. NBC_01737]|uniref:hypothetical protein n=1 Tax=Dactylosporangium sp. NBC_01737 TaxID=2975959 RepID=UPI002E1110A1|nr:hypothetical protein OHA72_46270 [Dactylosporangium sp. NBC_01737]